jgi:hypothetical protein
MKLITMLMLLFNSTVFAWDTADLKDEALSPLTTSARNVLYVGGGLTLGVLLLEDSIVDYTQKDLSNDKPLGSLSKFGDLAGQLVPNAIYALGQSLAAINGDQKGYVRAIGMLKASAYAATLTTGLKYVIREPRPGNTNEKNSFPSGHTTTAFAFSGYVLEEHGWAWGAPTLVISSFVAASRINDNRHYLHDVLAGATIGMAYGIGISKIDKKKEAVNEGDKETLTIVPIFDWDTKGLALIYDF